MTVDAATPRFEYDPDILDPKSETVTGTRVCQSCLSYQFFVVFEFVARRCSSHQVRASLRVPNTEKKPLYASFHCYLHNCLVLFCVRGARVCVCLYEHRAAFQVVQFKMNVVLLL